ncbi:MAG: DUF6044 family protein [Bacteroidota bacterium]
MTSAENDKVEFKLKLFSSFILILFLSPYLLFGEDVRIWIHDNLDSVLIYFKTLTKSGSEFASNETIVPGFMGGLPRACFISEYYFTLWLYHFLSPFTAYVFNLFFLHTAALIGAVLLLEKYIMSGQKLVIIYLVALCFALMPFWSHACLSIAGQPLLLYAFLNVRSGTSKYSDWAIIAIFPLFSALIFSPVFFVFFIFLIWLRDFIKYRKMNLMFLGAISLITIIYMFVEYRLILSFFVAPDFISHRTEFSNRDLIYNLKTLIEQTFHHFKTAQYHADSIHFPYLLFTAIIATGIGVYYKNKQSYLIIKLLAIALVIIFFYKVMDYTRVYNISRNLKFLALFQIDRFYTLYPLLWLLILGYSANILSGVKIKTINVVLFLLLFTQIGYSFFSSPTVRYTLMDKIGSSENIPEKAVRFNDFYSEKLFSIIKNGIKEPQTSYNVVNIGIDPAITIYNGFQNLDMYVANYPLEYKHKFREIMVKELDKNPKKKKYFDMWGSRCYLFVSEIDSLEINNLELNYTVLKSMNCQFIFSSKKINNEADNLKFIYRLSGNDYLKNVYIYKLL